MFPVEAEELRRRIVEEIIPAYLSDNRRARILLADGSYARTECRDTERALRSQTELLTVATVRPPAPETAPAPTIVPPAPPVFEAAIEVNGAPEREKKKKKDKDKKGSPAAR
jgi:hypothetical protein